VIVIDNRSGDILAMVGSADYDDSAEHGAVNVTTLRRRPGSTLKPFVYALALERGESPASLSYDVVLPGEATETYTSDVRQHGFARYREALAGSYNLSAVHTLQQVGVESLLGCLRRAGLTTLNEPNESYGPDLAIGNAEVLLSEYAGAFAAFGNGGRAVTPRAIRGYRAHFSERTGSHPSSASRATDPAPSTSPVWQLTAERRPQVRLFAPAIAYQVFDILSDPDARRPMFGRSAPMDLPFPVALKTGTTRGYTDNLAFGTTQQFTVGAWAGNFDGTPMQGVMAMQGAAPLVRAAFVALAARFGDPTGPERPATLVAREVCSLSGQRPGPHCPGRKQEWIDAGQLSKFESAPSCHFHTDGDPNNRVTFPSELSHWARARDLPDRGRGAASGESLQIAYPPNGTRFVLDPHRPLALQRPPLRALPLDPRVSFTIDGVAADRFEPTPGRHLVRAELDDQHAQSEIFYE
jgi:penicillin-binding protein 1C